MLFLQVFCLVCSATGYLVLGVVSQSTSTQVLKHVFDVFVPIASRCAYTIARLLSRLCRVMGGALLYIEPCLPGGVTRIYSPLLWCQPLFFLRLNVQDYVHTTKFRVLHTFGTHPTQHKKAKSPLPTLLPRPALHMYVCIHVTTAPVLLLLLKFRLQFFFYKNSLRCLVGFRV